MQSIPDTILTTVSLFEDDYLLNDDFEPSFITNLYAPEEPGEVTLGGWAGEVTVPGKVTLDGWTGEVGLARLSTGEVTGRGRYAAFWTGEVVVYASRHWATTNKTTFRLAAVDPVTGAFRPIRSKKPSEYKQFSWCQKNNRPLAVDEIVALLQGGKKIRQIWLRETLSNRVDVLARVLIR
jgi:hypothetical protein